MNSLNGENILVALRESGLVTEDQLNDGEQYAHNKKVGLARALKELGFASGLDISQSVADYYGMDAIDLETASVTKEVLDLVPAEVARRYKVVPISIVDDALTVAIEDPLDINALDNLRMILKRNIEAVVADADDISSATERYYGVEEATVSRMMEEISSGDIQFVDEMTGKTVDKVEEESEEDAPVIKLVTRIIVEAFKRNASDIHLEPLGKKFRIRYRIDGVCHEVPAPPRRLQASVLSRVKIMAGIDIAEKRLPQDGRILMNVLGRQVDFRVSSLPSNHGESIVLRILDKEGMLLGLSDLGFADDDKAKYEDLIQLPFGIMLITGPTGSGKTTTLYACLNTINTPDRKIITTEDPIEYMLPGVNQVHVNESIGLSFAAALRSILRQAPNVIMVGEIRDLETAEIAINAALTGHLVFSTLHTNDAPSAITRLIDQGVKPFLVASALQSVLAQRLVRRICPNCTQPYEPKEFELTAVGLTPDDIEDAELMKGTGCSICNGTGYKGRVGIYELMIMNEEIQDMIYKKVSVSDIRRTARQHGMKTLREDGLLKVMNGRTTFDEVLRITAQDAD
jgi:type IV pilus assembly protein PilB